MPVFPFNPAQYRDQQNLEQMPVAWYPARIIESEIVPTSKQDGFRLKLTFEIIDGPYKGRKVTQGYNIQNPSAQAVEIAMSEIKTICSCVGKYQPLQQSEELHNIPLQIRLSAPKDSEYNEIKGYRDINGNDPGKAGAGAPAPAAQMPPQGYGQPSAYPAQPGYSAPAQPQYAPAAPQQQPPAYQQQQQPQYQPQQVPQAPAPPAWAPPVAAPAPPPPPAPAPQAPAWTPGNMPAAPAWAPPVTR